MIPILALILHSLGLGLILYWGLFGYLVTLLVGWLYGGYLVVRWVSGFWLDGL